MPARSERQVVLRTLQAEKDGGHGAVAVPSLLWVAVRPAEEGETTVAGGELMCPGCGRDWTKGFGCTYVWCTYYGVEANEAEEKGADDNDPGTD